MTAVHNNYKHAKKCPDGYSLLSQQTAIKLLYQVIPSKVFESRLSLILLFFWLKYIPPVVVYLALHFLHKLVPQIC